ncbi:hypothetical protein SAMN03097721_02329 [Staphylococcus pasteuri]|uniref:Uncharacterized protein n=1 Tax=Staphylococcus pasteuri TaxID=45972 RepID=A0ABY1H912_9STAP|nr:hypothetical protein [Staphylococcus pasteuri]KKI54745.1 hypothetical protein UF70_2428 [Staphylococcus pasteuri]SFZ78596.1 hypothetical protein SAMN03097721_02329 [Staphylococcus pasteuri]
MSQAILDKNFQFLRGTGISIFNSEDENNTNKNENVYHYIANNLADLGYTLNDEDIIFTFSTNDDIKMILKDEEKNIREKDPAGQIVTERIAILTKDNKFYEYLVSLNEPYNIFLLQITQPTLEKIQPDYTKYKQNTYVRTRQFRNLDNLAYKFKGANEMVNLYGHIVQSNKTLQEISKEFLNRLL